RPAGDPQRTVRSCPHRRRERLGDHAQHHAACAVTHHDARDRAADHPALPGLRAVAPHHPRRPERRHAGARPLHLPDGVPQRRDGVRVGAVGVPLRGDAAVLAAADTQPEERVMVGSKRRGRLVLLLLVVVAFVWLVPVFWMVSMSLQPNEVLARTTSNTFLGLIPVPFTWENFVNLFTLGLAPRWFLNSMIVAIGMTAAVLVLSSLAGFAFARVPFRGKRLVMAIVLAG